MELIVPVPSDFNFYMTAPSTPNRPDFLYFSAPTSPNRSSSAATVAFDWEDTPGTPKHKPPTSDSDDFAFDFGGSIPDDTSATADELFEAGKIRPLKPPPRLHITDGAAAAAPSSPRSPIEKGRRIFREAFSPRKSSPASEIDPFMAAMETARRSRREAPRGNRRSARSLSPLRVSDAEERRIVPKPSRSRKWRLRDLLLFRSASEGASSTAGIGGRAKGYYGVPPASDVKGSSFRSTDGGSVSGRVSAHEIHYTANRAVSEELKKKTALPYRHGLLGWLGFNPTVHGSSRGTRGRS
ncbi:hypothetical protein QJS04_geneDACA019612 [Acorus gramineus]|uniref:Uncharacterized protein n=1 Tax=Acorus gramineus TaxID=55184 RepID=A0AAV9BKS1_ACOGR|nr:hypothetical protein QJS04_geneDACA019612 [Acorus gramineus]